MAVHCVIPDCQVKDGVDLSYLTWVGKYLSEKKPDVIVQIGDFADMPSLSSYDIGKKSFEGRRYKTDIEVTKKAMEMLLAPIKEYNERARRNKDKQYRPRMVMWASMGLILTMQAHTDCSISLPMLTWVSPMSHLF